jgi:hypothetical protein
MIFCECVVHFTIEILTIWDQYMWGVGYTHKILKSLKIKWLINVR